MKGSDNRIDQESYLKLVRLFEDLKNKFYETNYKLQQPDLTSTDRSRLVITFQIQLHRFELKLLDIKEMLSKND